LSHDKEGNTLDAGAAVLVGEPPMSKANDRLRNYASSLYLLAAAACFYPIAAGAQPPNPTASDINSNTAAGTSALLNVSAEGFENTGVGFDALLFNTAGNGNTASGAFALLNNTTGNDNTASGEEALEHNTTGSGNTAAGFQALNHNTTGSNNVALGIGALSRLKGSANIALGFNAGKNTRSGNSNIYIGHQRQ
jgi:hypothetical protein